MINIKLFHVYVIKYYNYFLEDLLLTAQINVEFKIRAKSELCVVPILQHHQG